VILIFFVMLYTAVLSSAKCPKRVGDVL
jgi:hypothetical protein